MNPLTAFALATQPGGDVLAALSFETEEQARTNADTRAELASGPAPGQGGDFSERFSLGEVVADGTVVTMDLKPVEGAFVLLRPVVGATALRDLLTTRTGAASGCC